MRLIADRLRRQIRIRCATDLAARQPPNGRFLGSYSIADPASAAPCPLQAATSFWLRVSSSRQRSRSRRSVAPLLEQSV
jgi:hypothetical protein